MKSNPSTIKLAAMTAIAIAAFLAPSARGESPMPPPDAAVPAPTLKSGDAVTLDTIAAATFLRGKAPETWEPDKLYVFECWATWCGPCVGQIPHLNALHTKFKDKGLRIYGMNVWEGAKGKGENWEGDKTKVEGFVKKQGDRMSYAVAMDAKGGPFSTGWLKAAGITGIPYAFVVKNGKLLFHTHPALLTDEVVTALLAGGDQEAAIIAKFAAAPEISVPLPQGEIDGDGIEQLRATAAQMGKAGNKDEAKKQLDAFLAKNKDTLEDVAKAAISLETMKAYFTAANDAAGAAKYAEELATAYPDALSMLCNGGVEGLKKMMTEDIKPAK